MIEKLKKKDIKEAAKVYNKGLSMEIPKAKCTSDKLVRLNKLIKILDKDVECFVHKTNNKIDGLLSFELKDNKVKMDFICSLKPRKGIGKKLIKKLADYCSRKKVKFIYSTISTKDKRVMKFYERCGFKKYGQYYVRKGFLLLHKVKAKPEWIKAILK